jgi:N6-adenosine-specific RNA methylase IME4
MSKRNVIVTRKFSNLKGQEYQLVYADPPWNYFGSPLKDQAAGKHYKLMPDEDLLKLEVPKIIASKSVLFMWATCPRLDFAIDLMRAWGFHYRGVAFVWVKTTKTGSIIGGQGVRPSFVKPTTELLFVGSTQRKGRPFPLLDESLHQVQLAARPGNVHSRKPKRFRKLLVQLLGSDLKKIELFARGRMKSGWSGWGNEVER